MGCTWYGDVLVVATSQEALLCDHEGDEQWIPKTQIADDSSIQESSDEGDEGELAIPEWLARDRGWWSE